eukprot:TRINITY_DN1388_c1_g1_i1.p1 TRINITY_DN1388_c1_g1~~TRINITY_DN1388_c1_g1_i1.p1  ORF type:complete len:245 (-),score=58.28 TRINITY_DN1388_c1_g1_i1:108-758(-)
MIEPQYTPIDRNGSITRQYTSSITVSVGSPIVVPKSGEGSQNLVHNRIYSQQKHTEYNCESLRSPLNHTSVKQPLSVVESYFVTEEKEIQKEKTERLIEEVLNKGGVATSLLPSKQEQEQAQLQPIQQPQQTLPVSNESLVKSISFRATTATTVSYPPRVLGLHNDRIEGAVPSGYHMKLRKDIDVQKENRAVPSDALEAYLHNLEAQQFTTQPWS